MLSEFWVKSARYSDQSSTMCHIVVVLTQSRTIGLLAYQYLFWVAIKIYFWFSPIADQGHLRLTSVIKWELVINTLVTSPHLCHLILPFNIFIQNLSNRIIIHNKVNMHCIEYYWQNKIYIISYIWGSICFNVKSRV